MADAFCGPSNALQNFKSHTSVDRTLQQDRIISRHQPGQGFRSHDPNAGILDPEFDAFQAGQPAAFAGGAFANHDSFQPFHHAQHVQNAPPSHAGPSTFQPPAWAADFQNLQITSPPPLHQQTSLPQKPAWASQFQQTTGKSAMDPGYASPGMQYNSGPTFAMNRTSMGAFQQSQFQAPLQESQAMQTHKDEFDEAAFDAAFDAAMEDAFQAQESTIDAAEPVESARPEEVDIYPHLPLVRLALLKAVLDGSDYSLHEAAVFVHQLSRHDYRNIDPIQAMLLRPLIARLADQTRSPFAQRYQMTDTLLSLNSEYENVEKTAQISPENEQLLAAYADALWGRNQSNHLQHTPSHASDASDWLQLLKENTDSLDQNTHPTNQAMDTLQQSNLWGLETPDAMHRVQQLELQAYRSRPFSEHQQDLFSLPPADDTQSLLFDMARSMADTPEVQEGWQPNGRRRVLVSTAAQRNAFTPEQRALLKEQAAKSGIVEDGLWEHQARLEMLSERDQRSRSGQDTADLDAKLRIVNGPRQGDIEKQEQPKRKAELEALAGQGAPLANYRYQLELLNEQNQRRRDQHAHDVEMDMPMEHDQHGASDLVAEQTQEDEELAQTEADQPTREDDELAQTAAELLGKMSHEKSDKFKNSAFLGLMRQLADREVKVEGDKIVETRSSQPNTSQPPAAPTTWSQSGPMQTPSHQQQNFPTDGQDVVDLLSQPGPLHLEDENTTLPTDNQEPMDFDASFITDQGMSAPTTSAAIASNTTPFPPSPSDVQKPSFPSWTWADSI